MARRERRGGVCTSLGDVSSRAGFSPLLYTGGVVRLCARSTGGIQTQTHPRTQTITQRAVLASQTLLKAWIRALVARMSSVSRKLCTLVWCLLVLGVLARVPVTGALQFFLKSGQKKCFSEDVTAGTRVLGEYLVTAGPGKLDVELVVTGPDGKVIFQKDNIDQGKFTFESPAGPQRGQHPHGNVGEADKEHQEFDENYGDVWPTYNYQFCLSGKNGDGPETKRKITLHVSTGAAAKDYSTVAKVEHLDNLEIALRRMEDEVKSILEELEHMRAREEAMRSINESVSRRVLWYSIISCLVMIGAGIWQARYLNAFFRAKKLI